MAKLQYFIILLFTISFCLKICHAQMNQSNSANNDWTPWNYSNPQQTSLKENITNISINPVSVSLLLWHELSTQDGPGCPFRPSCSGYMTTAIRKHGPFCGWFMGIDRFTRCHKWAKDYNYTTINNIFMYDPVE